MRPSVRTALLLAVAVGVTIGTVPVSAQSIEPIEVVLESAPHLPSSHGYGEYRFRIANHDRDRRHVVTLELPASSEANWGGFIRSMRRTVEVAPAQSATVALYAPNLRLSGSGAAVTVDGVRRPRIVALTIVSRPSYGYAARGDASNPQVLLAAGLRRDDIPTRVQDEIHFVVGGEIPSASWLGYSRYVGMVLPADVIASFDATQLEAIAGWVRTGGTLLILGEAPGGVDPASRASTVGGWRSGIGVGLGKVVFDRATALADLPEPTWDRLGVEWQRLFKAEAASFGLERSPPGLPVAEGLGVPVRSLFLVMIGCAAIMGPLNFLLLARRRRRIWVLWTVPLIAGVFSLAIFGFALVAEGWTPKVRAHSLTLLDQERQRATTIGVVGVYAPVTPRNGLWPSVDAELTLVEPSPDRSGGHTIDWTHGQHLAEGWISSRIQSTFVVRKDSGQRERIGVHREGTGLEVVNGLGVTIRQLWLADSAAVVHRGTDIPAGVAVRLEAPTENAGERLAPRLPRELVDADWRQLGDEIVARPDSWLCPGTYIAVVEHDPFLDLGLESVRYSRTSAVVIGTLGGDLLQGVDDAS